MKVTQKIYLLSTLTAIILSCGIAGCKSALAADLTPSSLMANKETKVRDRGAIKFQSGATSATVQGDLPLKDDVDRYTLRAFAGQPANINISSPGQKVLLTIVDPNGNPIVRYQGGVARWSGKLPASGTYIIEAIADGGTSPYNLRVNIQPVNESNPQTYNQGAIQFQPNSTSTTVRGNLVNTNDRDRYTFVASEGQFARININSPERNVVLSLIAPNGEPLLRSNVDSPVWFGALPMSGTYTVYAKAIGGSSPYALNLNIVSRE
ncbi:hypothetical protein ACE1CI_17870 [Aerosakkonemataceae cyanobacterium BLCC-F50]|uniref:Uncharacterized protein n=1 Tax=Floridaenema flaviceps BLCC-F50 TaxID=3153642 RepID=A0ABV4XSZ0_9CYAN